MDTAIALEQKKEVSINWSQIISLAALNAAVAISWIAYHNYQPRVLEQFQVTHLAQFLVFAQALVLVIIPPLAGIISDRVIKAGGSKFIVFTVGISITAMVFMSVAFLLGGNPFAGLAVVLPIMIVIWLISMNIFHSPANSMIELFAPVNRLPYVMAVLILVVELVYALEPVIVFIVDFLGAPGTFALGGGLLIICLFWFRSSTKELNVNDFKRDAIQDDKNNLLYVLLGGLAFGSINGVIMSLFPVWLPVKMAQMSDIGVNGAYLTSIILGVSALLAMPLSFYINKVGLQRGLVTGLLISLGAIGLVFAVNVAVIVMIALAILAFGFSMLSVSAFPFALKNLNMSTMTFGAGIFFGAAELVPGIIEIINFYN